MTKGIIRTSPNELGRHGVIQQVAKKQIRQRDAARQLGLSVRQVKRLVRRYREQGAVGLISGHRGKRANNAIADEVQRAVVGMVRERYVDFGPTLACEKLVEQHGITVSVETLRQRMISAGLRQPKRRKRARIRLPAGRTGRPAETTQAYLETLGQPWVNTVARWRCTRVIS